MNSPLAVLFNMVVNFASLLFFLRFMVQWADFEKHNPFAKTIYRLSAVVDIFTRIFPDLAKGRISLASLILLILLSLSAFAMNMAIVGKSLSVAQFIFIGLMSVILKGLTAMRWLIIISAVMSIIAMLSGRLHPMAEAIMRLDDPIVAPFRKIMPSGGMFDFAPMIAIFALILLSEVLMVFTEYLWGIIG